MSEAKGVRPAGDWFAAEVDVPVDVAVLNFVVQYYEHYDNNYGQDFKAAVQVDSAGRSVALLAVLRISLLASCTVHHQGLACCCSQAAVTGLFQTPLQRIPCDSGGCVC